MNKFEYLVLPMISLQKTTLAESLNKYGQEGWELVSILPESNYNYTVIVFKRIVNEEKENG